MLCSNGCAKHTTITTEHPITIVDSLQQIVAEEVSKRAHTTESEWAVGVLMDAKSGTVLALYDTDSTLSHAQTEWEMGTIISPLALAAAYSVAPMGWDSAVVVSHAGWTYNGHTIRDPHPQDTCYSLSDAVAISSRVAFSRLIFRAFQDQPTLLPQILNGWGLTTTSVADSITSALEYSIGYQCTINPIHLTYLYACIAMGQNMNIPSYGLDSLRCGLHKTVWDNQLGTASINHWGERRAQSKRVQIAGQTGSAQFQTNRQDDKYGHRLSFVGYFPEGTPEYVCLVIINNPRNHGYYSAGADCGMPVRRIAERICH